MAKKVSKLCFEKGIVQNLQTTFFSRSGCTQWHFASDATNYVYTFNYQTGADVGKHLAHQRQVICVRQVLTFVLLGLISSVIYVLMVLTHIQNIFCLEDPIL